MNQSFKGWKHVAAALRALPDSNVLEINEGQAASLLEIANRLPESGVIIADEVGMGKTRIAAAIARSVIAAGGRVAILVPPGLGYQWSDELRIAGIDSPPILRSLWQFLRAWGDVPAKIPWFKESALVISHSFSNWRLGTNAATWRWALLPAMYARWRKHSNGRWPRSYCGNNDLVYAQANQAASSIVDAIGGCGEAHPARRLIHELAEGTPWPGAQLAAEYGRNAELRPFLERAVGLGMGLFDLVIVDEAHKSRGHDSGLNRLLEKVVLRAVNGRCVAMTATPVELDVTQWNQILGRIQVNPESRDAAAEAISAYATAVERVRQCPSDKMTRDQYKNAAKEFKRALDPYLLRRDKREEPAVIEFQRVSGENYHSYRHEQEILVDTVQLTPEWKRSVCAAEALSFATRRSGNTAANRLRLTLGNGHGIAALIDKLLLEDKDDNKQAKSDAIDEVSSEEAPETATLSSKRILRSAWWQDVMIQPFRTEGSALFDHPAILAAVDEIESVCKQGGKVLVFGRFTRPLRAITQLLNAREMLRCVDELRPWPQSRVHESEWPATCAAHRQLRRSGVLDHNKLDVALDQQYKQLERQRRSLRDHLIRNIEDGLDPKAGGQIRELFGAFKKDATTTSEQNLDDEEHVVPLVARALQELIDIEQAIDSPSPIHFARAFSDLVEAASDRDEGDSDGDGQLDEAEASSLWEALKARLKEEYSRSESGYARLMYGETKPATRRFLQLAFNRKQAHPRVLVAQSLVGREGLNLHKACRTVVLLHPEWNPGVVEQQIGRIDRIGSLWEDDLKKAIAKNTPSASLPRIEVRPVVFRGTYDEKNWQVLRSRWDDLRAQLHGIVISSRIAERYLDSDDMVAEINDAAPNFSPSARVRTGE